MKLTPRQEDFIRNLMDLYREVQGPTHYSVLAERLNVSRFTAYDMLRLLEEKGLVTSDYQLAADKSGPGRSQVVFMPTARAHRVMAQLAGEVGGEDWEAVKERALEKIYSGEGPNREWAEEILARVPSEGPEALRYCIEVMTIIALRLRRRAGRRLLLEYLPKILPTADAASRANLSLLAGFGLGVLADETAGDREWHQQLFEHVKRYHELVAEMDPKLCRRLALSLKEVFAPLKEALPE